MTELSGVELGKQKAAYQAVDENVHDNMVVGIGMHNISIECIVVWCIHCCNSSRTLNNIEHTIVCDCNGIGSGSTVVYAVQRLAELIKQHNWSNIVCIPTSFQSELLIIQHNMKLGSLNRYTDIDVTIDGSDECDAVLNCIKGGGACQLQEKLVASNSKKLVIIADSRKNSDRLGQQWHKGVPVEVHSSAYACILNKLQQIGAHATLRQAGNSKAGPVVTDNGNFVIDADFGLIDVNQVQELDTLLCTTSGVIETGLFVNMASVAYFGGTDGTVTVRRNDKAQPRGQYTDSKRIQFGSKRS